MHDANNENQKNVEIIKTDINLKNGQDKCPKCGATDISININNGNLRCNFCRYEFKPEMVSGLKEDINKLEGQVIASGALDIETDSKDIVTLKCSSCAAEVVIDTSESAQARCHWCRNTLSINEQIPNGSIPDVVLPFSITKDIAKAKIENFVDKRKFFAHPKFKKEFTTNNIMGVYFPYMLVDVNAHSTFLGKAEKETGSYYVGSDENRRKYYNADVFSVKRDFDLTINGLSIESSSDKLNNSASDKTNNVINAIMPFDVENCVKWNANYLKGYSSEKRDTNIEQLKGIVDKQSKDIARFAANDTIKQYDRGACWSKEGFEIKGQQWKSAYLPVWLYSYQQIKGSKKMLHYVAVNARTKETMGSVPIHMPKLIAVSTLVELIGIFMMLFVDSEYNWIFLLFGIIFFIIMYLRYRNSDARHSYETETKKEIFNLIKEDIFVESKKGLSNYRIEGANNTKIEGSSNKSMLGFDKNLTDALTNNELISLVNKNINKK